MVYILQHAENNTYVAPPGSIKSYTPDRMNAREYPTLEDARRDKCGNEIILETMSKFILRVRRAD